MGLLSPGTLYGEQSNVTDLRVAKILRVDRTRMSLNVNFYNVFNNSTPTLSEQHLRRRDSVAAAAGDPACALRQGQRTEIDFYNDGGHAPDDRESWPSRLLLHIGGFVIENGGSPRRTAPAAVPVVLGLRALRRVVAEAPGGRTQPPRSRGERPVLKTVRATGLRSLPAPAYMKHVIVGTAGHIDHGKSSLVLALTGTDPGSAPGRKGARDHHRPRVRPHGRGRDRAVLRRRPGARAFRPEHAGRASAAWISSCCTWRRTNR